MIKLQLSHDCAQILAFDIRLLLLIPRIRSASLGLLLPAWGVNLGAVDVFRKLARHFALSESA